MGHTWGLKNLNFFACGHKEESGVGRIPECSHWSLEVEVSNDYFLYEVYD